MICTSFGVKLDKTLPLSTFAKVVLRVLANVGVGSREQVGENASDEGRCEFVVCIHHAQGVSEEGITLVGYQADRDLIY